MIQSSLLPIVCTRTKPPPSTAAADFIGVEDATTHRWLCKGQARHPMIPASEWICSQLAAAVGLPVPPFAPVECLPYPGLVYFGSQWLGGAREFAEVAGRISNPDVFARTHAVDLFVHNIDRHRANFLYLDLAGDIVARVIDFSHALLVIGWPMPDLPLPPCNTMAELGTLLAQNAAGHQRPTAVVERIAALPDTWMRDALERMPDPWLARDERIRLRTWWVGNARVARARTAQSLLP